MNTIQLRTIVGLVSSFLTILYIITHLDILIIPNHPLANMFFVVAPIMAFGLGYGVCVLIDLGVDEKNVSSYRRTPI